MLIPQRPFASYSARNRAFDAVIAAVTLCESDEQLTQLKEEITHDLARLATDEQGQDIQAAIADAFSAQAALIKHKTEFPSC